MHRGGRDAEPLTDPGQRPPVLVELPGLVDVVSGQARMLGLHAVAGEDRANGSPVDSEPVAKLVDGCPVPVVSDQLLHLVGAELPGSARNASIRPGTRRR